MNFIFSLIFQLLSLSNPIELSSVNNQLPLSTELTSINPILSSIRSGIQSLVQLIQSRWPTPAPSPVNPTTYPSIIDELNNNEKKWTEKGINSYIYSYRLIPDNPTIPPYVIHVENGQVKSVFNLGLKTIESASSFSDVTLTGLLKQARADLTSPNLSTDVAYNGDYGFPSYIYSNPKQTANGSMLVGGWRYTYAKDFNNCTGKSKIVIPANAPLNAQGNAPISTSTVITINQDVLTRDFDYKFTKNFSSVVNELSTKYGLKIIGIDPASGTFNLTAFSSSQQPLVDMLMCEQVVQNIGMSYSYQ